MIINRSYSIVGSIKFAAKIRVMDTGIDTGKVEDPSLEVIKLLWMLINKHASDLNEGIFKADICSVEIVIVQCGGYTLFVLF